jgi:hypothetical protein
MAKMYYNEEEAAQKLGVPVTELTSLARQGKLQQYRDGSRMVYKADQVDALAGNEPSLDETGEIELAPADTGTQDMVSLSEADNEPQEPGKDDTVITAEGISIFDDEDLEIEAADPMAKTQIAPSLEDQVSIEGVGSGSGLLDLTRESDDTSLGAEVLEHIDMESGMGEALEAEAGAPTPAYQPSPPESVEGPIYVEAADPTVGLFSGLTIGGMLVMLVLGTAILSAFYRRPFPIVESMMSQLSLVLGGAVFVLLLFAIGGYFVGKSMAQRQAAMRRAG